MVHRPFSIPAGRFDPAGRCDPAGRLGSRCASSALVGPLRRLASVSASTFAWLLLALPERRRRSRPVQTPIQV